MANYERSGARFFGDRPVRARPPPWRRGHLRGRELSARSTLAAVVREAGAPFELRRLGLGEPRADELAVRVEAVGICHTDVSVAAGKFGTPFPIVVGHEGTGVVEAVGAEVEGFAVGDRVVLSFDWCGHCRNCTDGRPTPATRTGRATSAAGASTARPRWRSTVRRSTPTSTASRRSPST